MLSFGITIVALASVVAPGVLFVVSFFTFSIIKRTAISFGPAIDVAMFFSLSLLINGLYGWFIGWLSLRIYDPCGQPLLPEIHAVIGQLFVGGLRPGGCSAQSSAAFFYIYLALLCVVSCIAGAAAVAWVEIIGLRFAHGVFTKVSSVARRRGVTICSALCKFGGQNSFVIYIGEVREIVLDDKNSITYLAVTKAQRSLLRIEYGITASKIEAIPLVGKTDEFIIPGASIENVAFSHFELKRQPLPAVLIRCMVALLLAGPVLVTVTIYSHMLSVGPKAAEALPPPAAAAVAKPTAAPVLPPALRKPQAAH